MLWVGMYAPRLSFRISKTQQRTQGWPVSQMSGEHFQKRMITRGSQSRFKGNAGDPLSMESVSIMQLFIRHENLLQQQQTPNYGANKTTNTLGMQLGSSRRSEEHFAFRVLHHSYILLDSTTHRTQFPLPQHTCRFNVKRAFKFQGKFSRPRHSGESWK